MFCYVFGVPFTPGLKAYNESDEAEDNEEEIDLGFTTFYNGQGYCGIVIHETESSYALLADKVISEHIIDRATKMYKSLNPSVRRILGADGFKGPELFLIYRD